MVFLKMNRIALALLLSCVAASGAGAQDPARRIEAARRQAAAGGLPVEVLDDKVAEGRAKGVPLDRVAAAVEHRLADRVQQVLDELINPRIAAHGGSVELVDLADNTLYVRMLGGCQGCAASAATLRQGVERMVREELPEIEAVVDLTDHTAGANPYY